jgi:hypothetical protein
MGESAAATVKEIEQTRDRLEEDLTELQDRLPAPAVWAKRAVGVAATGGAAVTVAMLVLRRRRKKKAKAKAQAEPVNMVVQVLPDAWAERIRDGLEDGSWKPWAAGAAGLYVAFRLAEVRQLRRMNRALVAAR